MLKKVLLLVIFAVIFLGVIFYVEPPKSWEEASLLQILAFFLPLLVTLTIFLDFFVRFLPHSFILSLGLILMLAFYGANELNFLTGALVILITIFSWRVFPKLKLPRFRLTGEPKIPKLHTHQEQTPNNRRLRRLRHG